MPSVNKISTNQNQQMPVIESETNRICLAYWKLDKSILRNDNEYDNEDYETQESESDQDEVFIVLSKLANAENFTITCSVRILIQKQNLKIIWLLIFYIYVLDMGKWKEQTEDNR